MSGGPVQTIQATAWYPPYSAGGTEAYVEDLAAALAARNIESAILVPAAPSAPERYTHAGRLIETYPVEDSASRAEITGRAAPAQFAIFQDRLRARQDAIYHQHSWSRGCGPLHLRAARELGLRTVLTIHVPAAICLRGTMVRFGASACEGQVQDRVCGACWAHGRGLPGIAAAGVAAVPLAMARRFRTGSSRVATALAARALGDERVAQLRGMVADASRIVVVCGWLRDALAANGVPAAKIVLSRQGLSSAFVEPALAAAPRARRGPPLRLLYLGRMDRVKGIDIAVRAVRAAKSDVTLTIRAPAAGAAHRSYETRLRALAGGDPRIRFEGPIARPEILAALRDHDVLVAPSIWLETGPLVVLEAQAAGVFVLGSRLGGIAELVEEGNNGALVEPGDIAAWTKAIENLAQRFAAGGLAPRPQRVRTMTAVAADMAELYGSL